ncbi:aggregation factor core [Marinomonas pollencensis]|uniref:Calx-beta domain-containing protein n=1 Tax=Marinomonas pollencensis TaxID=491954 RepID=A0A3E0DHC5_9GAMM|nr:aggregation factor core [Marinomonas pollencensis]REG82127.1 hypothetical protein DFP81_11012 [Marinomonas pollencensis]
MSQISILYTVPVLLLASSITHASVAVRFVESAPKDRFVLTNTSQCEMENITANIDLANSTGKLIFDTTATGAGVDVFQPFEAGDGNIQLTNGSQVNDGATKLSIKIAKLQANEATHFTIDVDDTLKQSEWGNIRVSGSEIENATIEITSKDNATLKGTFDNQGKTTLAFTHC